MLCGAYVRRSWPACWPTSSSTSSTVTRRGGFFHRASTGLLLTALTGDATTAVTYGLEGARVLGALRYSRQAEEETDAEGMRMMAAAGIDPAGMIGFFETLKQEAHGLPDVLGYLSTHPSTDARIARLRTLARELPGDAGAPAPGRRLGGDREGSLRTADHRDAGGEAGGFPPASGRRA